MTELPNSDAQRQQLYVAEVSADEADTAVDAVVDEEEPSSAVVTAPAAQHTYARAHSANTTAADSAFVENPWSYPGISVERVIVAVLLFSCSSGSSLQLCSTSAAAGSIVLCVSLCGVIEVLC